MLEKFFRGIIHGTDDPDFFLELVFDDLQCLGQIAVIGYDDSAIIEIEPGVIQQMHGKVDIGTFFFRFYDPGEPQRIGRGDGRINLMTQEMPIIDAKFRYMRLQRPDVVFCRIG